MGWAGTTKKVVNRFRWVRQTLDKEYDQFVEKMNRAISEGEGRKIERLIDGFEDYVRDLARIV